MLMCIEYKFKERKRKRADAQRNCEDGGKTFFFDKNDDEIQRNVPG
jgi:hypothetical protein